MSDTPRMAKHITATRQGFSIDGEEFPWYVSRDGYTTTLTRDGLPGVTVTIVAERVSMDDDLNAKHS